MPMISGFSSSFSAGRRPSTTYVPPPPNPASINVWYDASSPSVPFVPNGNDNTAITQWSDSSSAARNANPSGGGPGVRPIVKTNVLNGYRIVRFNGVAQNLQVSNTTWAQSLSGFTILTVAKFSSLVGTRTLSSTDENGFKIFFDGTNYAVSTSGGTGTSTLTGDTTNFHIFSLIYDGSATGNANRLTFRYDKSPQTLTFAGTVGATTSATATKFNIGWYSTGLSEYFAGDVAEFELYTRTLTPGEIATAENYLSSHWGLA
jgi:hypothetical protein